MNFPFDKVDNMRMWVHRVLPLVYDDSLSYAETLWKVVAKLNEVIDLTDEQSQYIVSKISELENAWNTWKTQMNEDINLWESESYLRLEEQVSRTLQDAIVTLNDTFVSLTERAEAAQGAAEDAQEAAETAQGHAEDAADHCDDVLESIPEDYSTLSNDVADLKSAIVQKVSFAEASNIDKSQTGNEIINVGLVKGSYIDSSGEEQTSSSYGLSDYIAVTSGDKYIPNITAGGTICSIAMYNSSKVFDSTNSITGSKRALITIPDGVSYIRISASNAATLIKGNFITVDRVTAVEAENNVQNHIIDILNADNLLYWSVDTTNGNMHLQSDSAHYNYHVTCTQGESIQYAALLTKANELYLPVDTDIYITFLCSNPHIFMTLYEYRIGESGSTKIGDYYNGNYTAKLSANTRGQAIRISLDAGYSADHDFILTFSTAKSNAMLSAEKTELTTKINTDTAALQTQIDGIVTVESNVIATLADFTEHGYLNDDGSFTATTGSSGQWSTDFIPISNIVYYSIDRSKMRKVCVYDTEKTFLTTLSANTQALFRCVNVNDASDTAYIRMNISDPGVDDYVKLYTIKDGDGNTDYLNSNIKIHEKNEKIIPYIGLRKPLIAFILDGEYDMNDDMHDVFAEHGVKCGFAPQYKTEFPNNSLATYLEWQAEGFEILSHGATNLKPDTPLTDDEAIQTIENVHPHRFRRTLATSLIDHGMAIQEVATLLGHDKIDTTMTYVFITQDHIQSAYNRYQ